MTSASPPAIGLPSPTSTAVRRHVTRPTGARRLTANACSSAAFAVEEVLIGLRILFKNAKISPQLAKDNMTGMAETARRDRAAAAAMRRHWLAAGYPATFPTVRDIDAMIAAIDELRVAIGSKDLAATPRIYLALNSASVQYTNDVTAELCFPS